MSFADDFTFTRPTSAPFVDAAGVTRAAAIDAPRFDHAGAGQPPGLLIEGGDALGQSDAVRLRARDWSAATCWTVLHDWNDGQRRREAHYARDPAAMIDGCLGAEGHHYRIAAFAGYLRNYGGWVWGLGQRWELGGLVGAGGVGIASGGRALLVR